MAWTVIGQSNGIGEGEAKEVVLEGEVIAVFRYNNELFALEGMCAHQGGPLAQGKVADGCVTCPWHGWQYLLANGNNATTCKPMLRTFPIREEEGLVEIFFE